MARRLELSVDRGVYVSEVRPGGLAAEAGLTRGDVITRVEGEPVANVGEFRHEIEEGDLDRGILLRVVTGDGRRFVSLRERR